jgi:hypothetical protein
MIKLHTYTEGKAVVDLNFMLGAQTSVLSHNVSIDKDKYMIVCGRSKRGLMTVIFRIANIFDKSQLVYMLVSIG